MPSTRMPLTLRRGGSAHATALAIRPSAGTRHVIPTAVAVLTLAVAMPRAADGSLAPAGPCVPPVAGRVVVSATSAVPVALPPKVPLPSPPDSLKDIKHVEYLLYRDYYLYPNISSGLGGGSDTLVWTRIPSVRGPGIARIVPRGGAMEFECSADGGDVCDGGDGDKGICEPEWYCHSDPRHFLDVVTEAAVRHPESGFLTGQAVYALVKYLLPIKAMRLVQKCRAAKWWCDALHGYAFQRMGDPGDAAPFLRRAMAEAPDSVSCAYTDATWLLGNWDARQVPLDPPRARERTATWSCARRRAVSDTIWWLADPLYSVPGNYRWEENIVRSLTALFQQEIVDQKPWTYDLVRHQDARWSAEIRRGPWDSYTVFGAQYTGKHAARYHFVPDVGLGNLSSPVWHLDAHLNQEGYTPPGRPFSVIPAQVARFRRGDSLRVAVATTLRDAPVEPDPDSASWLIFTDGPGSFPLRLEGRVHGDRSVFLGEVAPRRYVVGLEVHGDSTIGWHRQTVAPLDTEGPGLSDLLLYRPTGPTEPDSLLAAAGLMLGSTTVEKDEGLGVYWETYGLPVDTAKAHVSFTVTLVPRGGGIGALLGRLVPGGGRERGLVAWTEPGTPGTHRRAIALDLSNVDPGDYTLVLRAAWPGQPALERRLDLTVE